MPFRLRHIKNINVKKLVAPKGEYTVTVEDNNQRIHIAGKIANRFVDKTKFSYDTDTGLLTVKFADETTIGDIQKALDELLS